MCIVHGHARAQRDWATVPRGQLTTLHVHALSVCTAGEMSATVVREPQAWTKTVSRLKADIVAGRDDADQLTPNLKIGVSTNFNKLVSLGRYLGAMRGQQRQLCQSCSSSTAHAYSNSRHF